MYTYIHVCDGTDVCTESRDTKAFLSRKQLYLCRHWLSWVHNRKTEPRGQRGIVFHKFFSPLCAIHGNKQTCGLIKWFHVTGSWGTSHTHIARLPSLVLRFFSFLFFTFLMEGTLPHSPLWCLDPSILVKEYHLSLEVYISITSSHEWPFLFAPWPQWGWRQIL